MPFRRKPAAALVGSIRVAAMAPVTASRVPCTSSAMPTAMPVKPPVSRSSITVVSRTSTVCPRTTMLFAAASTEATGPTSSGPNRTSSATARGPVPSSLTAPPWICTCMPSLRLAADATLPSSSSTLAAELSKRTPLTITEPKPLIAPAANERDDAPVVADDEPASPPPPQPTRSMAVAASWITRCAAVRGCAVDRICMASLRRQRGPKRSGPWRSY